MHAPANHHQAAVSQLGNAALLRAVATCAGHSRQALVRLLRGLGEVEARSLHAAEGFSSLYDYCRSLSFSESEAYKRCAVARASRRFPLLLVALESGSLHLTGAAMLVKHLTPANQQSLLQQAAGLSKRALEVLLLAQSAGRPAATASPRNFIVPQAPRLIGPSASDLRTESAQPGQAAGLTQLALPAQPSLPLRAAMETASGSPHPPILVPRDPSTTITDGGDDSVGNNTAPQINRAPNSEVPTGAQNYRLHVTLDAAALQALRQAQDLLGHRVPTGDLSRVLGMALQGLVERLQTQKFGKLKTTRSAKKKTKLQASAPLRRRPTATETLIREPVGGRGPEKTVASAEARGHDPSVQGPPSVEILPAAAAAAPPTSTPESSLVQHPSSVVSALAAAASPTSTHELSLVQDPSSVLSVPAAATLPTSTQGPSSVQKRQPGRKLVPKATPRRSRAIPRALKRAVYERDRVCTYQAPSGRICGSTSRLEFHHLHAFGLGGEHSLDNITLRCACHNAYAALLDFGAVHMNRARGRFV